MKALQDCLRKNELYFALWTGLACFLAYFCMYMFRKPFTAGTYAGLTSMGVDYKIVIIIAQVLGYAISKFIGIKVIAELKKDRRITIFISLIAIAWLALVGFAYTPITYGPIWLFINGMPLGMIWGIVFTYCEGRRLTEILTVLLAANFIITSGIAKTFAKWFFQMGYSEQMTPMMVGAYTFPLLLVSLWMLRQIPPPSSSEQNSKQSRKAMTKNEKITVLRSHGIAITSFVILYILLTIIRDIRDNFAVEIWSGLGFDSDPEIFTRAELPVTIGVLILLGLLFLIREHFRALRINLVMSIAALLLVIGTTYLQEQGLISSVFWMVTSGIGIFVPYILMNGIIFDRFIAAFQILSNVGFIMYIADASGYVGSILIMLFKNFGNTQLEWLDFYQSLCYMGGSIGILVAVFLWFHLQGKHKQLAEQ